MTPQDHPDWSPETRLLYAASTDDATEITSLVSAGVSADTRDAHGEPALHLAARLEKRRAAAALMDLGADLRARGPAGMTLAHLLAAYPATLPLLADAHRRGAPIDDGDDSGQTPLMTALHRGHVDGARSLLGLGANPRARDDNGATAVYHFITGVFSFRDGESHDAQLAFLRELIARGANPNAPGPSGRTAATEAAARGLTDVLRVLQESGADLAARAEGGLTPLQTAAVHGRRREAMALLATGIPLDFCSAVALGMDREIVDMLAADAALANAVLEPPRASALSLAIRHGHGSLVRLLLARGADPNGPDPWTSSLHSAIRHLPDPAIVRLLIDRGADVEAVDGDLNTPLNLAARSGRIDLATPLLDAGADPNARTDRGVPLIEFAASDEMRALLRSRGAA